MFRKSLLAMMIIAALPVIAATDRSIYVNTTDDEDGENANACSLREATKAATLNKSYGGCIAGQTDITDQIKLKAGIYNLNSSLIIGSAVNISGEEAADFAQVLEDPITNLYPIRSSLKTTIQRQGNTEFSLFDSSASRANLGLNNLMSQNGLATNGGTILAGGNTTLSRVNISGSKASRSGGAIYLAGSAASLTATDTLFTHNTAPVSAVIGMSCIDNVKWTPHTISLDRTSIIDNGSNDNQSIISYCGTAVATINASTVAKNTAKHAIFQYEQNEANNLILHPSSSLTLSSNTIVNNSAKSTLIYDNVGRLNLTANVLAYNAGGKSCRYTLGKAETAKLETSNVFASFNAIIKPTATEEQGECDLPNPVVKEGADTSINLEGKSFDTVLSPLIEPQAPASSTQPISQPYLLPYYLPRSVLVDVENSPCTSPDQRSFERNIAADNQFSNPNQCDIGSVELGKLAAGDVSGATNSSLVGLIQSAEDEVKFFDQLISNKDTDKNLLERYKFLSKINTDKLAALKNTDIKRYRQVYVDVFANSTEQEKVTANTSTFLKFTQDDAYSVQAQPIGTGPQQFLESHDEKLLNKNDLPNQTCEWNPALRQVLISRISTLKDRGATTPSGDFEYCKYTIIAKDDHTIQSTGYIQATIVNIAPIATDDNYTLKYGSTQEIPLNILANDNDDGDGAKGIKGYPENGKPFFEDPASKRYANIKISQAPTQGKLVFEYEQPCPDNSATRPEQTCFGGKLVYKANNAFSPFNDSFKYKVLDNDLLESNEATVTVVNTATTTNDTRKSGGALGICAIIGLAGLAALRRKIS